MIPYSVYKVIHLVGIMMVYLALGGAVTHALNGGERADGWRKTLAMTHGVGLVFALIGGFGLLARLGLSGNGLPGWIYMKLVIWMIFGGATAFLLRKPALGRIVWAVAIALGALAAYLAGSKPF
jgi:hypothetical protein